MKTVVVLLNMGGPQTPKDVYPFLKNLFLDPYILRTPLRPILGRLIARLRAPKAQHIYAKMGGGSPLVIETHQQACALEDALKKDGEGISVVSAMRYTHPRIEDVFGDVYAKRPDRVILLSLYPQFSTTTTESAVSAWIRCEKECPVSWKRYVVGCYPNDPLFIQAHVERIRMHPYQKARLLFSAHGLPLRIVKDGDPYPKHVSLTVESIVHGLGATDYRLCYQSRVGPLKWLEPSLDFCLREAGREGVPVIVVPVAFVSEHSETLVELDMEYREKARAYGVLAYDRVEALRTHPMFIEGLRQRILSILGDTTSSCPFPPEECACQLLL